MATAIEKFLDDLADSAESLNVALNTAARNKGLLDSEEMARLEQARRTIETILDLVDLRNNEEE